MFRVNHCTENIIKPAEMESQVTEEKFRFRQFLLARIQSIVIVLHIFRRDI